MSYAWDYDLNVLKIIEENEYYPYGLKHSGYNADLNAHRAVANDTKVELRTIPGGGGETVEVNLNQYKFNGQEWQSELNLNMTAMDYRQYDNAIGRFNCPDPITHFRQSPYQFGNGNPIYFADPSGLDGEPINTWHYAGGGASNSFLTGGAGNLANGDHMFGGSGDAFWMGQGATTWSASPISVSGNNITINWSSFGDGKTKWTASTNTIKKVPYISGFGTSVGAFDNGAIEYATFATVALAADDVSGVGVIDDVLIPGVWAVAGATWLSDNSAALVLSFTDLVAKQAREIERIRERVVGPPGFVYELRATRNGLYPNRNTGGTSYLNIGDVYKYGQTIKGFGRYTKTSLENKDLEMIPIYFGSQMDILIQEKIMIYGYYFMNGERPAGNPIFR